MTLSKAASVLICDFRSEWEVQSGSSHKPDRGRRIITKKDNTFTLRILIPDWKNSQTYFKIKNQ